jgi:hypothetical protein
MDMEGSFKLRELIPGDILQNEVDGDKYVFIGMMDHPLYPELQLVLWWKWEKGYVLDALSPAMRLPFSKLFRYPHASDVKQVMQLAILTWQQSGASLRG